MERWLHALSVDQNKGHKFSLTHTIFGGVKVAVCKLIKVLTSKFQEATSAFIDNKLVHALNHTAGLRVSIGSISVKHA